MGCSSSLFAIRSLLAIRLSSGESRILLLVSFRAGVDECLLVAEHSREVCLHGSIVSFRTGVCLRVVGRRLIMARTEPFSEILHDLI